MLESYIKKLDGMNMDDYRYDCLVESKHVLCFSCALARNGLIYFNATNLTMFTTYKEIDKVNAAVVTYYYNPDIDYEYEVRESPTNPLILIPSKERTLVECIKYLDCVDEGLLVEGLNGYLDYFWDGKIYKVADHFGVKRETIDYWLQEAREDCEV